MRKSIYIVVLLFFFSCASSKKSAEKKYYPEGYSLDFQFDSISHEYILRSSDPGVDAIIPQFDSIVLKNNVLFLFGSVIYPRIHKLGKALTVGNVNIIYAQEKNKSNRLVLIDSLGISSPEGKINLQIQNPKRTFYLLLMKDSLIPCAQIINSKLIKRK